VEEGEGGAGGEGERGGGGGVWLRRESGGVEREGRAGEQKKEGTLRIHKGGMGKKGEDCTSISNTKEVTLIGGSIHTFPGESAFKRGTTKIRRNFGVGAETKNGGERVAHPFAGNGLTKNGSGKCFPNKSRGGGTQKKTQGERRPQGGIHPFQTRKSEALQQKLLRKIEEDVRRK